MIFKSLSMPDLEQVRQWRNDIMASLRTPFLLTEEMQQEFYVNAICNRSANSRYWGIWKEEGPAVFGEDTEEEKFIGLTGIDKIQWENRTGEITLLIAPDSYGNGYGAEAVQMLLDQGFNCLNLENIYGECYLCSPAIGFWKHLIEKLGSYNVLLPARKYFEGKYYDALYFNFSRQETKP